MNIDWHVQGTPIPCRSIDYGSTAPCCECPIVLIADAGNITCACPCHDSAKIVDRRA